MALTVVYRDRTYSIDTVDRHHVTVDGQLYDVRPSRDGTVRVSRAMTTAPENPDDTARQEPGGQTAWVAASGEARWVFLNGRVYELARPQPKTRRRGGGHDTALMAPMPATVRRIAVGVGEAVRPGDTLLVLEAMKMELPVRAAVAGTIRALCCREGELVQPGVALIEIDAAE